jgi:uncharacterized protein
MRADKTTSMGEVTIMEEAKGGTEKPFRILSLDGGGIRGVFPAKFLSLLEADLKKQGLIQNHLYERFDLICGTSTGGIIAIGLALGIPAIEIYEFYLDNAGAIFGSGKWLTGRFFRSKHLRHNLETLIREKFCTANNGKDPLLGDCKTSLCIPSYDLLNGKPILLKTKHHPEYIRDHKIPAFKVALATSAAPTFFDPLSTEYTDLAGNNQTFSNKVDGGVYANNPTLIGIFEAQKAFGRNLSDLRVLSIGTGTHKYLDASSRKKWGIRYWLLPRPRIIDLFMQGQSQHVDELVGLLHRGIGKKEANNFNYHRVNAELDASIHMELDEFDRTKLQRLSEKAQFAYQENATKIIEDIFL